MLIPTDMSPSNAKCIVLGVPSLKELFAKRHYHGLEGGILENFGRLLSADMVCWCTVLVLNTHTIHRSCMCTPPSTSPLVGW